MFLSDELFEIGSKSNPKNNLSQAATADQMLTLLKKKQEEGTPVKNLMYSTRAAIEKLNKAGFSYFKVELFFKEKEKVSC